MLPVVYINRVSSANSLPAQSAGLSGGTIAIQAMRWTSVGSIGKRLGLVSGADRPSSSTSSMSRSVRVQNS